MNTRSHPTPLVRHWFPAACALAPAFLILTGCASAREDTDSQTAQIQKPALAAPPAANKTVAAAAAKAEERKAYEVQGGPKTPSPSGGPPGMMGGGMPSDAGKAAVIEKAAANPSSDAEFKAAQPGGSFGGGKHSSFGRTSDSGWTTRRRMQPQASAAAPMPRAIENPNMYVANTYIGGNGERERMAKLIQAGVMVDGKQVKLEAFAHNYAQSFPIPQHTALALTADTVQSKIIRSGAHTYLQVGLQAMKGEMPRRPPLNIALVIDRSGSMRDENKLEYVKSAAARLVDSLTPADYFTLVAFDETAETLVPAQHVTDKAAIRRRIAALQPGGSTNIYDGLARAYEQLHKHRSPDGVNRVILLSDGEVTAGVQDAQQFHHLAASEVDKDVETSAVGVGVEFNEDLMLSLARDGKGNYHFLKDGADTQQVFARELDELTHVVARDVKLRIQLAPGVGLIRVLGAPTLDKTQTALVKKEEKKIDSKVSEELGIAPNRQNVPDEPGIKMLIPAFYRGDSHVVMLEIKVPPVSGSFTTQTCKLADVSVKYKDLVTLTNREESTVPTVTYTPSKDDMIYSVNRPVKKNLLGFQTGEALTQAAALIEQGRVGEAIQKVDERMTVLGVAAQQWNDRDLERDGKLLDRYKTVLAQLNTHQQLARGEMGQYLRRSLTYNGYQMTR